MSSSHLRIRGLAATLLLTSMPMHADDATVGTGTPASCTATAFNAGVAALQLGQGPGGTLRFNCGVSPHTIAVSAQTTLEGQITIDGGGLITLDGSDQRRIFLVNLSNPEDRTEVQFQDLTLTRGRAQPDFGGAILANAGTRTDLLRVTISNSVASVSGGALAVAPGNTQLNITDSRFAGNLAQNGGALAISSSTVVRGSSFSNNNASGGEGGAIQSYVQTLSVVGSTFAGNGATLGGAIFKRDAAFFIDDSAFRGNTAAQDGGAVACAPTNALNFGNILQRSSFQQNAAVRDGGAVFCGNLEISQSGFGFNSGRRGGALYIPDTFLLLQRSTLHDNTASEDGGGIYLTMPGATTWTVDQVTTSNNTASSGRGGDVRVIGAGASSSFRIESSTLFEAAAAIGGSSIDASSTTVETGASMLFPRSGATCQGTGSSFVSFGSNLGSAACGFNHATDAQPSTPAGFGMSAFANFGGPRSVYLPLVGSSALERNSVGCRSQDARGKPRPVDADANGVADCDTGAVERQLVEVPAALFRNGLEDELPL